MIEVIYAASGVRVEVDAEGLDAIAFAVARLRDRIRDGRDDEPFRLAPDFTLALSEPLDLRAE